MDLTTCDEQGRPYDFDKAEMREEAKRRVAEEKPYLLIGSPMCTMFSKWQDLRKASRDPVEFKRRFSKAMVHLRFLCELYKMQIDGGRYFLHEHPDTATSWKVPCIESLTERSDVMVARADLCMFGLMSKDADAEAPAEKPTRFMTNSLKLFSA